MDKYITGKDKLFEKISKYSWENIDLHCHTTCSDGSLSPKELVDFKVNQGIKLLSIADHDTLDGIGEGLKQSELQNIDFLSGVELSSSYNGIQLHILAYGIDYNNSNLKELCAEMQMDRCEKNEEIFDIVDKDFNIDIRSFLRDTNKKYIGKPDIGRILVKKGYFDNLHQAFDKYFKKYEIEKIKRKTVDGKKAIELIGEAGGVAVLAHPILVKGIGKRGSEEFYHNLKEILVKLKSFGLSGIEAFYEKNTFEETERLRKLAKEIVLIETRGSDFHG